MLSNMTNDTTNKMPQKAALPRQFDKIILTLENCLLPENKLEETPSQQDGLDKQVEIDLRILGCELIQIGGILLRLPQVAMATGQVLFQRFYYSKSFLRHNMETTAMSCICLASKIEEAPRRIRDVINVFHHIKQVRGQKPIQPMLLDATYIVLKTQVIKAERRVLKELGFCVHVKHPHKLIVMYLQVLGYEKNQELMQMAWNYMNDSLRTDVFVRYNPESIACACIYLTARKIKLPLPINPPWYGVFKVTEDEIHDISYKILDLYRRHKPNAEALEQAVEELRKKYNEIRIKNKAGQNTPPMAVTTVDRNNGSHNAWGGFISRALPVVATNDNDKPATQQQPQLQGQSQQQQPSSQTQTSSQQQQISHQHNAYGQKRSHSRSRSRSRSVLSHSPNDDNRSRTHKKSRHRSYSSSKKKSSRYSKSMSVSPSRHNKKRDRKSPMRDKSDYYNNGDRNNKERRSDHRTDRSRDKDRSKHDRYSNRGSSGGHRSSKHQERFRDRKR